MTTLEERVAAVAGPQPSAREENAPRGEPAKSPRKSRKPERYLSVSQVAAELKYKDPRSVRQLIATGQLEAERLDDDNKEWKVSESALRAFQRKPRGRPKRISKEMWRRIERAVKTQTVKEVAEAEGISPVTIHRHLKTIKPPPVARG